jgi:thioredoxin reductase
MLHDALIIGGGFAGLSAANVLARARRNVLVIDAGAPRNRFSSHAHNMLGHDGRPGSDILADARKQLATYPNAKFEPGRVESLRGGAGAFEATLDDGREIAAHRIVLATGVADLLPEIPGLAERWGQTVLHCPYCHGYEINGGPIGVLAANAHAAQHAALIADWGEVVLFANGVAIDEEGRALLARRRVTLVEAPVAAIEGHAPAIEALRLTDGARVAVEALFIPVSAHVSPLVEALGCETEEAPFGAFARVDAMKQTSVRGVYAAGDTARGMHSIVFAAADGMMAGVALHRDLIGL